MDTGQSDSTAIALKTTPLPLVEDRRFVFRSSTSGTFFKQGIPGVETVPLPTVSHFDK